MIEDLFGKDCSIKIQYTGSPFMDAVKEVSVFIINQLALAKDVFELLRYDKQDPNMLALMGLMTMSKGDMFLKFKNL